MIRTLAGGHLSERAKRNLSGYVMLLPEILVFGVFLVYPLIRGMLNSFYSFKGPTPVWTGLANFTSVFHDDLFWIALKNTSVYTVLVVPGGILVALVTSWLIYPLGDRAQTFYKGAFYLPGVVSGVVVGLSWKWIFEPTSGLFNYILSLVHLGPVPWLTSPNTALYSLVLMVIMGGQGASIVIILANMMAISQSIFESARLDGCNSFQLLVRIMIPLLRPVILYLTVLGVIGSYQVFDSIFVMTSGGPYRSTTTLSYLIYQSAFQFFEFGKASAMAALLFLIVFGLSVIQFRFFREDV